MENPGTIVPLVKIIPTGQSMGEKVVKRGDYLIDTETGEVKEKIPEIEQIDK